VICDGTGGVEWICVDNGLAGNGHRQTVMTYPIFTTDLGTLVDLRHGVWTGRHYDNGRLQWINLAALNHHSLYCGATSAVKNIFGVVDLSGGADPQTNGKIVGQYYNFHAFAFDSWLMGPRLGAMGLAVGTFLSRIRRPDLNITTAYWIGLCSRTALPVAHTKVLLASTDPVALDYYSTKYILYPNSRIQVHNPDRASGPLYHDLRTCAQVAGYVVGDQDIDVISVDVDTRVTDGNGKGPVKGKIHWGLRPRALAKYLVFRTSMQSRLGRLVK
jgi:hypothetical protein